MFSCPRWQVFTQNLSRVNTPGFGPYEAHQTVLFSECFNQFLRILSLPQHFKNAYIPRKRNHPLWPQSSFHTAPMPNIYYTKLVAGCFSHGWVGLGRREPLPISPTLAHNRTPTSPGPAAERYRVLKKVNLKQPNMESQQDGVERLRKKEANQGGPEGPATRVLRTVRPHSGLAGRSSP